MISPFYNCQNFQDKGFTLIEVLVAMAVGSIIMAAVTTSFLSQHRNYIAQDNVVEMQQNARVAMDLMTSEIRSARYTSYANRSLGAGINTPLSATNLVFTRENNGALETIRYALTDAYSSIGRNDGIADDLGREINGGGLQPIAENISNLEFLYLDEDGNVTATVDNIRSIQISILAVASQPDPNFTNTNTYTPASGVAWDLNGAAPGTTPNDHYRRRLIITTVQCRNLGS